MILSRQFGVGLLLCCLNANAVRVSDDVSDGDFEKDGQPGSSQALVPADYWAREKSGARCKAARRGRNIARWAGGVVGAFTMIPAAVMTWYAGLWLVYKFSSGVYLMVVRTYLDLPLAAWGAFLGGTAGVSLVTSGINKVPLLFGQGGNKPVCCCSDGWSSPGGESLCGLVGTADVRRAACPPEMPHYQADKCESAEPALAFDAEATAGGCKCADVADCATNKYFKGHAWCQVQDSTDCKARRFKLNPWKRWDFCQSTPSSLEQAGETLTFNTYVSQFTINEGGRFRQDPRFVFRFGSWVDTAKALVIAPLVLDGENVSACMPGEPEDTLDGCAQRCVEEGAPIADETEGDVQRSEDCVAFAYNHHHRLCVRLPANATGAEFRPYAKNPELPGHDVDGWSNYKLIA